MANVRIIGSRVIVQSFTDGDRIIPLEPRANASDEAVLAHALWLERHCGAEEAIIFLDRWDINTHRQVIRH